jgi:hypothetical protein
MNVLKRSQKQTISFVMLDLMMQEASGANLSVSLSKASGPFQAGSGTWTEIGSGWYAYEMTTTETDTLGPIAIMVTAPGCLQQNLTYAVENLLASGIEFTYTLEDQRSGVPIANVVVWISTDINGNNIIWIGKTNIAGEAVDTQGQKPWLVPDTYYFWRHRAGYVFTDPDTETITP